ncbi:hypothetical protein REMIM1_PF00242 (plasmid) [Rhizobium etli bv. mimosae str. Mim1]|nr:hypothetical protein REMIM1_PF00242 [Rhizobium etli bv. mimosae str. Mim1]
MMNHAVDAPPMVKPAFSTDRLFLSGHSTKQRRCSSRTRGAAGVSEHNERAV